MNPRPIDATINCNPLHLVQLWQSLSSNLSNDQSIDKLNFINKNLSIVWLDVWCFFFMFKFSCDSDQRP